MARQSGTQALKVLGSRLPADQPGPPAQQLRIVIILVGLPREERVTRQLCGWAWVAYTVISESCSLVRFRGWLRTVMPYSSGSLSGCRLARRMALWATLRKLTRACQPLLLNHTWRAETAFLRLCWRDPAALR